MISAKVGSVGGINHAGLEGRMPKEEGRKVSGVRCHVPRRGARGSRREERQKAEGRRQKAESIQRRHGCLTEGIKITKVQPLEVPFVIFCYWKIILLAV